MVRSEARKKTRIHAAGLMRWAMGVGLLFLLSRGKLLGDVAPFSAAAFSAGLVSGIPASAMLVGCALGMEWWLGEMSLQPLMSCALVGLIYMGYKLFLKITGLPVRQVTRRLGGQDLLAAAGAGVGVLVSALSLSHGLAYNAMSGLISAMIASLIAPCLISGLSLDLKRKRLLPDERLSLALLWALSLMGMQSFSPPLDGVADCAAMLSVLIAAGQSSGMGCLAGVVAGAVLSLSGGDYFFGAALSLCGLLAGSVRRLGRWASALMMSAGNLLSAVYGLGYVQGVLPVPPLIAAGALYLLIPSSALKKIWNWMAGEGEDQGDALEIARLICARERRQTALLGAVFEELAQGYGQGSTMPGEQQLIAQLRKALCSDCPGMEKCWGGGSRKANRLLCRLLGAALTGHPIQADGTLPPEAGRSCRRASQINRRLGPLLTRMAEQRSYWLKCAEGRAMVANSFRQAQALLEDISTRMERSTHWDQEAAALAREALLREGLDTEALSVLWVEKNMEIWARRREGWTQEEAELAAQVLSEQLGGQIRPVLLKGKERQDAEMRFIQAPMLTVTAGAGSRSKGQGARCGDSYGIHALGGGKVLLALSDGMGSGERASRESAATLRMMKKFLAAGLDSDQALNSINALLLMQGGEEMFATADICLADLRSGRAEFVKLGGCLSVILREGRAIRMEGGRLPLGILESVQPYKSQMKLMAGDMLVMVSDGIADSAFEEQEDWLVGLLNAIGEETPQRMADQVLEAAMMRDGGKPKDDMTVLVAKFLGRRETA